MLLVRKHVVETDQTLTILKTGTVVATSLTSDRPLREGVYSMNLGSPGSTDPVCEGR